MLSKEKAQPLERRRVVTFLLSSENFLQDLGIRVSCSFRWKMPNNIMLKLSHRSETINTYSAEGLKGSPYNFTVLKDDNVKRLIINSDDAINRLQITTGTK